ncbi:MAG: polysaccharide biosynthesis/export family protein [Flavobacteriaceae bacterium]
MTRFFKLATYLGIISLGYSCVSPKQIHYFQNDTIDQEKVTNIYTTTYKPDDLLRITVSSQDIVSARPFNSITISVDNNTNMGAGQPIQQPYLVDNEGYINFPVIGRFKIGGLTRNQAIEGLTKKISPEYIKEPIINIVITNFTVSILGDVRKPGYYTIPNERLTIMDAIALAGDLNISGIRNSVTVTREEEGKKNIYSVDLLSSKLYTSEVYYLKQNDLIYIKQNNGKIQGAATNPNSGLFISIAAVIISILTLAIR